jgi:hypothetical protein
MGNSIEIGGEFVKIYNETEKENLIGILENSVDWYLVLKIVSQQNIELVYANKVARENCSYLTAGSNILSCADFSSLFGSILQVAQTRERMNFPQYVVKNGDGVLKVLDLQIYANNGNVIVCGRDLEPIIYEFRANTALLNHKLEKLLATVTQENLHASN